MTSNEFRDIQKLEHLIYRYLLISNMDPNLNRMSMGSRAGTSIKPKFGAQQGAVSRQGTAIRGLNPLGGVGATVQVKDRPLTTGGGINGPQGVSTQRKVYDRNYYVTKIKQQMMNIQEESQKLTTKTQTINKQQQLYNKLEQRQQALTNQVRNLQGQLADYNLALDKLRVNTRPEDVKVAYHHVKNQNDKLKAELDNVFLERKKIEEQTQIIQNQLTSIHQQMEMRLNELDPYQRNEYQRLINQNHDLMSQYSRKNNQMDQLLNKLANAQNKLKMDSQKLKGQLLKEQVSQLQTKKTDYQIQLNEANLSIPEARDRILNRMKEDNSSITNMQKRTKQVKKNIDIYEKKLRDLQVNLQDKKTQEEDKKKYEILYQRDRQMDQFLNSFDQVRQKELEELDRLQKSINDMLQQTGKVLQISNQLPGNLAGNVGSRDRSQNTAAQTKTQYEIRLNNLRALQTAEHRTAEQVQNLKSNIGKMREQITNKFERVDQFKDQLITKKAALAKQQEQLGQIKQKLTSTLTTSDYEINVAQKKYQVHDLFASYSTAQKKLQQSENQVYYLKHFINTKSKDINYEQIKNDCLAVASQLNKSLLK